jgi:zinc protease
MFGSHASRSSLAFAVIACVCCLSAFSTPAGAQPHFRDFLGYVEQRHLDNGLTVVVQEDHRVPQVALTIRYEAGDSASPPGMEGTATVATFLMVGGPTEHVAAGDYRKLLLQAGASNLQDQATDDRIEFDVTVPSSQLALPLWLWSDQMGYFAPALTDERLAKEKAKLREMRRVGLEGAPTSRIGVFANEELFPRGYPNRSWMATLQSIDRIDRAAVRAFHDRWIVPHCATLVIVGDVKASEAFGLVERYFGTLPGAPVPREPPPVAPPLTGEVQLDVAANVPTANVSIRWLTPRDLTTDDARLDVVAHLLSGNQTNWINWKLVDEQKVATSVTAYQSSGRYASQFVLSVVGARGRTATELLAAVDSAMDAARTRVARQREINGAVYELNIDPLFGLEGMEYRAQRYARFSMLVGTPSYIEHNFDRYLDITPGIVHETIARWLPPDKRVVLLVTPKADAAPGGEQTGRRFVPTVSP